MRSERAEGRERGDECSRVALEVRHEMLDEVDLVDVAALDGRPHLLDGGGVLLVRPASPPATDLRPAYLDMSQGQTLVHVSLGHVSNGHGCEGKPARLRRRRGSR